jgi:hypothetical protein
MRFQIHVDRCTRESVCLAIIVGKTIMHVTQFRQNAHPLPL